MFEVGKKYRHMLTNHIYECMGICGTRGWMKHDHEFGQWVTAIFSSEEWREEPIEYSGWVNIYSDGSMGRVYSTAEAAREASAHSKPIATIHIKGEVSR